VSKRQSAEIRQNRPRRPLRELRLQKPPCPVLPDTVAACCAGRIPKEHGMSSNPGSLGVYAELIPRVDGFVGAPEPWEEPAYYPAMPVTQDQIDRGMQQVGVL